MSENENPLVEETASQEATEVAKDRVAASPESDALSPAAEASLAAAPKSRRQEKIGLVTSNKMTRTVVVRVERQVRHPKYKRYIRRRKKFMAHDDLGVNVGDIVKIIETRPLSARKRWRVIEVVQKAS